MEGLKVTPVVYLPRHLKTNAIILLSGAGNELRVEYTCLQVYIGHLPIDRGVLLKMLRMPAPIFVQKSFTFLIRYNIMGKQ